jgi:menaquinone-dependent protoporphyrinogen oxidase
MFTPILVVYASRFGSTREVAETIAATLRQEGHAVDINEMHAICTLDGYRAVVIGAPFTRGRWHDDVRPFLEGFRAGLIDHPVAIFALGPAGGENDPGDTRHALLEELKDYPWLHPIAAEMFGDHTDADCLEIAGKVMAETAIPLHGIPSTDRHDWDAIRSWAQDVGTILQPATT